MASLGLPKSDFLWSNLSNENRNEQNEEKNPLWIKIALHIIVLRSLIRLIFYLDLFTILLALGWIYFGHKIQRDKILVKDDIMQMIIAIFGVWSLMNAFRYLFMWLSPG